MAVERPKPLNHTFKLGSFRLKQVSNASSANRRSQKRSRLEIGTSDSRRLGVKIIVNLLLSGFIRSYANQLTFARVHGEAHFPALVGDVFKVPRHHIGRSGQETVIEVPWMQMQMQSY